MAEGYLRHAYGGKFDAASAGVDPKGLNPLAVEAMRELGIDISGQESKQVTSLVGQPMHYVVTVCDNAKEQCPIFPGAAKYLHWSFEDPAATTGSHEQCLGVFRRIRDEIRARIDEQFGRGSASA